MISIIKELKNETERLLFDEKPYNKVKVDPTKSYLDYLKLTKNRSQRTVYDGPENTTKQYNDSGINMSRIYSAIVDDYLTLHYSDHNISDNERITGYEIMNGQLSMFPQMNELLPTNKEKKSSATDYILGIIPKYIILGGRKFTNRKLIRVIYRFYVDRAKKYDTSTVKSIVYAIDKRIAIRIDMDETNFIIASWKENGGE